MVATAVANQDSALTTLFLAKAELELMKAAFAYRVAHAQLAAFIGDPHADVAIRVRHP